MLHVGKIMLSIWIVVGALLSVSKRAVFDNLISAIIFKYETIETHACPFLTLIVLARGRVLGLNTIHLPPPRFQTFPSLLRPLELVGAGMIPPPHPRF